MAGRSRWAVLAALTMVTAALLSGVGFAAASASTVTSHSFAGPSAGTTNYTSSNWAGYFAQWKVGHTNGSVTRVTGTWVQPTLNCASGGTAITAIWVGIDGAAGGSMTVEQTGSLGECISGVASYYVWWELYPLNSVQIISGITPHAGDTITANVTFSTSTHKFTMSIKDGTKSFSKTAGQSGTLRNSAECIVERPSNGVSLYNLAKFGTATFSTCTATIAGSSGGIGSFPQVGWIDMMGTTKVIAQTSALTSQKAFSVTWKGYH
jgi:hypothetical protein